MGLIVRVNGKETEELGIYADSINRTVAVDSNVTENKKLDLKKVFVEVNIYGSDEIMNDILT